MRVNPSVLIPCDGNEEEGTLIFCSEDNFTTAYTCLRRQFNSGNHAAYIRVDDHAVFGWCAIVYGVPLEYWWFIHGDGTCFKLPPLLEEIVKANPTNITIGD